MSHLNVTVANGERLRVQDMCAGLQVDIQGKVITFDFFYATTTRMRYSSGCIVVNHCWTNSIGFLIFYCAVPKGR